MRRAGLLVSVPSVTIVLGLLLSAAPAEAVLSTGWGMAEMIETDNAGTACYPEIAVDASGNAVAVWFQYDGTQHNIWANRYVVGTGWGAAELIETENAGDASDPRVAVDMSGNAVAVWFQYDGTLYSVYANRYVVGTGWGAAELVETNKTEDAYDPDVAVDASGNAVAVWCQYSTQGNIWANQYVVGTGWGTAALVETSDAGDAVKPEVAVDGFGNAVAVWLQYDGTWYNVYANRYVVGTGWEGAKLIETDNMGNAGIPDVAVNASGDAVAVWSQYDGTWSSVYANRYVVGTGWGAVELIETNNAGSASRPHIAVNGLGNAVAVWHQHDGTWYSTYANRYVVGTGWEGAKLIETDNMGNAGIPDVAVDACGNAVAVWNQYDGFRDNIWANRYVVGTGWGSAGLVETDDDGSASSPNVAVDGFGNAVAVWSQSDGIRDNIWANRYETPSPIPEFSDTIIPVIGLLCVLLLAPASGRRKA